MRVPAVLAASLLAAACAPQSATIVEGEYTAFLAASNSITFQRKIFTPEDFERGFYLDCRDFEDAKDDDENEQLRLGEGPGTAANQRIAICLGDGAAGSQWPPSQETWMADDGFMVIGEALDPWRGEAIITSEGDVQMTFHQRLPGGEDFRFAFVIDPDFQPKECVEKEDGSGVEHRPIDGDWVENWSADLTEEEGGGRLFYLNASAYQFDPESVYLHNGEPATKDIRRWFLPNEWLGGHAEAKFGDDRAILRTTRYGEPAAYLGFENQESSVGSLDLVPDVYTGQVYYCQPYIEKYDTCLDPERIQTFDACMDAAEQLDGRPRSTAISNCRLIFQGCIEDEVGQFSGNTIDQRPGYFGFDGGFSSCASDFGICARNAMDDGESSAPCEEEFRTCVDTAHEDCLSDTQDRARAAAQAATNELRRAGIYGMTSGDDAEEASADSLPKYGPRLHTNLWREADGLPAGIDGWMELNYNWVHFDEGSDLEAGGSASGEFMLTFDARDSASRFFVRARFEVDKFRKDRWTTAYLPPIKFEQNGTTECGDAPE